MAGLGTYSLALYADDVLIFHSDKSGLRPLVACIKDVKDYYDDCVLYDKVIGLAAAKLIFHSRIIQEVHTPLASRHAVAFLQNMGILIQAETVVEDILNKDRSAVCPMEKKAMVTPDPEEFFNHLSGIFSPPRE